MIRGREEILAEIRSREDLSSVFDQWMEEQKKEFLDFCSGARGVKMLYDSFSKHLLNPETVPERLNELLSLLLGTEVAILHVLPNDNSRIADESSLVVMDIVVQLADGGVANVEIQKIGYLFPGQRSACYSADLLLRQYVQVRRRKTKDTFSYHDIKNVYTIVFFESSPSNFSDFPNEYIHFFEQKSNTGLEMELLQKFIFISLDIFKKKHHNRNVENRLEAWMKFLSCDDPDDIISVIQAYPDFKTLYEQVYEICRNIEGVMDMFSKELQILDRNTVRYMIDEMREELDRKKAELSLTLTELSQKKKELNQKKEELSQKDKRLTEALNRIKMLESGREDQYMTEKEIDIPLLFIGYPKCSTCQKAKTWLDRKGLQYTDRNIKEQNPTADELKAWHAKSGFPIKKFFNTSGLLYKELGLKDKLPTMSEEAQFELLSTDGMLVKRPILVRGDMVLVGFKEKEWEALI